jgi:hypothetical protein
MRRQRQTGNDAIAPESVELTEDEKRLVERIHFNLRSPQPDFDDLLHQSCEAAKPLALSLLKRNAIPQIRLDYFTDPEYNIGVSMSRKDVFERNGTRGDDILGHGNFLDYLRYFICGPNLPESVTHGFCELVNHDRERPEFAKYVRQQIRQHGLDPRDASEEFYKLGLECDLTPDEARSVRDAARTTK